MTKNNIKKENILNFTKFMKIKLSTIKAIWGIQESEKKTNGNKLKQLGQQTKWSKITENLYRCKDFLKSPSNYLHFKNWAFIYTYLIWHAFSWIEKEWIVSQKVWSFFWSYNLKTTRLDFNQSWKK